jgi:hypothetical protein
MTMPHLMNCPHCEDWCLDCVKSMHDELTAAAKRVEELEGAMGYLSRLFKAHAPQCEPMDYPGGLVSQIDNCMAGMRDEIASLTTDRDRLRAALQVIESYGIHQSGCCPYGCDTPFIAATALSATSPGETK